MPDEYVLSFPYEFINPMSLVPGSALVPCSICGHHVWVSPFSQTRMDGGAKVVCVGCAPLELLSIDDFMTSEEQLKEMSDKLGRKVTRDEVIAMAKRMVQLLRERPV